MGGGFESALSTILLLLTGRIAILSVSIAVAWTGYQLIFAGEHNHNRGVITRFIGAVVLLGFQTVMAIFV